MEQIMQKGNLTRDEAIAIVGVAEVEAVEVVNCEPTNRVGYNWSDSELTEWSAAVDAKDKEGRECSLVAYYYVTKKEIEEAGSDLGNVDWTIYGYEIY